MSESTKTFLTGVQAAEFLGVKAATLYAYASRGLIESVPSDNGRERWYKFADLLKLRQSARGFKSTKDAEEPVWTGPVIKSAITEIREDAHFYRGQSAIRLALSDTPFEDVAELLWDSAETATMQWQRVTPLTVPKHVRAFLSADVDYLDFLKVLFGGIEIADPVCRKLSEPEVLPVARRLIATMATTPGISESRDKFIFDTAYPVAHTLLNALCGKKSNEQAQIINRALVLCADHELNASTLAARVAASCDASLYSCLISALGTFSGRLHGSASRRAEDIVTTSLKYNNARAWLKDFLRQSSQIPGFGTYLYAKGDPRARVLIESAKAAGTRNTHLRRLNEIVELAREQLGVEPNLDFGLAAIAYALALPPGSGSIIFAVSRTAGWIAHAIEQRAYGGVIRPRARYIGKT